MAATFKFHSQINETVPWQAQYSFPTQATRVNKQVVKLPPKNGSQFNPGQIIRIEFPADNYLNVLNSVLQLDLTVTPNNASDTRLQRTGAHSVIKRLRIMYGSLVMEDIQEYKTLVRVFTEAGVQNDYLTNTGSILDGMYDTCVMDMTANGTNNTEIGEHSYINVSSPADLKAHMDDKYMRPSISLAKYLSTDRRTYCLNLMSGLLTCKKLIPLKWMAAQLAIEITLSSAADALLSGESNATYVVNDCNYIAEMLEFDSTYDTAFFQGLTSGGVPLKFSSWHFHSFNMTGQTTVVQIHERSRSVKAALAVVRDNNAPALYLDTDRFFHRISSTVGINGVLQNNTGSIGSFQWRVGGRYYPSQPVSCKYGGAEALVELMKTLNALGDYTRSSTINPYSWTDYEGGPKFIMSAEFENTDVMPDTIAGINAEEQSDIALTILAEGAPNAKRVDVFVHFDALMVVRDGNVVDLVM